MSSLEVSPERYEELRTSLNDQQLSMEKRMRSLFTLKALGTQQSVDIMSEGINSQEHVDHLLLVLVDPSVLLAHESAYCLGQTKNPGAVPALIKTLENLGLNSMVRHEVPIKDRAVQSPHRRLRRRLARSVGILQSKLSQGTKTMKWLRFLLRFVIKLNTRRYGTHAGFRLILLISSPKIQSNLI